MGEPATGPRNAAWFAFSQKYPEIFSNRTGQAYDGSLPEHRQQRASDYAALTSNEKEALQQQYTPKLKRKKDGTTPTPAKRPRKKKTSPVVLQVQTEDLVRGGIERICRFVIANLSSFTFPGAPCLSENSDTDTVLAWLHLFRSYRNKNNVPEDVLRAIEQLVQESREVDAAVKNISQ